MKKRLIILTLLFAIIVLIFLSVFQTGNNHIVVVEENVSLANENGKLKEENKNLISENSSLKLENSKLNTELTKSNHFDSIKKAQEKELEKIIPTIVKIEKDIKEEIGWTTPEIAKELLKEKLNRNPTREEFKKTLEDLFSKNLLFQAGYPDPYVKGKKITKQYIDNL